MSGEMKVAPNAPRIRWRRVPVMINCVIGDPVLAEGFTSNAAPGLAVTFYEPHVYWSVTHMASGHAVGPRCYSRKSAQAVLLAYAPLTDWTQSADDIWRDLKLCRRGSKLRTSLIRHGDYAPVGSVLAPEAPASIHNMFAR